MLKYRCASEYLEGVRAFAKSRGLENQLEDKFKKLANELGRDRDVFISKDFAPYSFLFDIYADDLLGNRYLAWHGGLIYQGPPALTDGSSPSLSISLYNQEGWYIHT